MIIRWEFSLGLLLVLLSIAIAKKDASDNKCPMLTECPFRAEQCAEDEDCSSDSICCKSPCGKVCTKQLFTGCQTLRMAASRRAKSLGVEPKSVRMPRCSKSGAFEPVQCDNEIVNSCWCVDEAGFELAGTRAPAVALVNCTAPKACADHTCRMFCPHGFALTSDGCPQCRCRDPCDGVRCPNALECQLEELACADPPCPPVPTCKRGRSLESLCPVGDPLRISDTVRPFLCGSDPGKPTCPPMYQCLVQRGNDYGVCCPASLKLQKTGTCPAAPALAECGMPCAHDLECPSVQKCCRSEQCGASCIHPTNVTECHHQRSMSEVLAVSERAGKGYVPQCAPDGHFVPKQCSRNRLVCWCVDPLGRKLRGSMGPAGAVACPPPGEAARSLAAPACPAPACAAICEYGFRPDERGCASCRCDDACAGYTCPEDEECVSVREAGCGDALCASLPVCRPKAAYANPCEAGAPLTDEARGAPVACALRAADGTLCPLGHDCTAVPGSTQAVCCPRSDELEVQATEVENASEARPQTMCEYLHDFSTSMEGTREGMNLALPTPTCTPTGDYVPQQCDGTACWCVDHFGTEIPRTRTSRNHTQNCTALRASLDCLDLTCRMGCEYGFELGAESRCPLCQCRDPCAGVRCAPAEQCQLVEVSCKDHYCPPVPACLPRKPGQCPYLVPPTSTCDFGCTSDTGCNGTQRCCSNGCGTQCTEPLLLTACEHRRALAEHQAHEAGVPASRVFIPACESGAFASRQCNPSTGECWCVDHQGFELSQSRTTGNLTCAADQKHSCALYKCGQECEHGFELDENGCRTCDCVDPCARVSCRGEGETCRLVKVECVDFPCPSVPMCLPKKENPCQSGEPLKLGGGEVEVVSCGPEEESCPSSHKCQLSPVGEYAVCCPKPRDVCFEPLDKGSCKDLGRNLTRFYFNSKTNKCELFVYEGCNGNHNNFYTEDSCHQVCPVLSQCERLREKNQLAAERYAKPTFQPRCEPTTGTWQPVQCLEHVGVCWCVSPAGEPLKGTLTRGAAPECNFRQARLRATDRADDASEADLVLEELMAQLGSLDGADEPLAFRRGEAAQFEGGASGRCEALGGQCDANGKFTARQCEGETCWCVDEAGNQLPRTNTFKRDEFECQTVPVESVEVTLGFRGEFDELSALPVVNQVIRIVRGLNGVFNGEGLRTELASDALFVRFALIGSNKVDVAYRLEQMVMQQRLPGLTADITRSRVLHKLMQQAGEWGESVLALEHREIVSQSPVSIVAPYHTALIVIAAASAFVICVLLLLVVLYKRKMNGMSPEKVANEDGAFSGSNRPIYIELPNEKFNALDVEGGKVNVQSN